MPSLFHSKRTTQRAEAGFTLVEVMIALLLGMIGLMGTVAIQQTVMSASQNANDGQVAMRLATQTIEEFNARVTRRGPPVVDLLLLQATGNWSAVEYLNANGAVGPQGPANRWARQWRILNTGAGSPYDISVTITYNLDSGTPKVVRLDVERRKEW
jgi:type II secretory pathway pseudopilin PulG